MQLFEGEQGLLESDKKTLVLTTHRVRFNANTGGNSEIISIMLDAVSSCRLASTSIPIAFWFGAALIFFGVILIITLGMSQAANNQMAFPVFLLGIVFIVIYVVTRKQVLEIASASASIRVDARKMSRDEASRFIDAIEKARSGRMVRNA
jgi:hypothetical protein